MTRDEKEAHPRACKGACPALTSSPCRITLAKGCKTVYPPRYFHALILGECSFQVAPAGPDAAMITGLLLLLCPAPPCRADCMVERSDFGASESFPAVRWQCVEDDREAMRVAAGDVVTNGNLMNPPAWVPA